MPWDKWAFWFLLFLGAAELALRQSPIARRRRAAFVILSTLGVALLVAAFPFRYSGEHLSVLWLMEAEAILRYHPPIALESSRVAVPSAAKLTVVRWLSMTELSFR